jgi:hypothetical protein
VFPYFVPISLLVLAGFTLGLLVGWLVWGSSKPAANREPKEPEGPWEPGEPQKSTEPQESTEPGEPDEPAQPDETQVAAPAGLRSVSPESTPDPPIWQVREVPAFGESVTGVRPSGDLPQTSTRSIGR